MRPAVDLVVPFLGDEQALRGLLERLHTLSLGPGDSLVVVDNRPPGAGPAAPAEVVRAPDRQSSYHARNRGAMRGKAPWLLFLDADVLAPRDIVDRYFAEPVDAATAVLAGRIEDVEPDGRLGLAGRYARLTRPLNDDNTWRDGFAYAQTASAAVRRSAFEAVGGFAEVRSGGDADLCFRLAEAGWRIERRPDAVVQHRSRASMRGLVRQYVRYGAGSGWLDARYPGFNRRRPMKSVLAYLVRGELAAARALVRGDRAGALRQAIDPICATAFAIGRRRPKNGAAPTPSDRPGPGAALPDG
jgi:mycofactocin glycosyltransferase